VSNKSELPKVVLENCDKMLEIRKRRNACKFVVCLVDAGILQPSQYANARPLLKTLNKYWMNGGNEGTYDNPHSS